MASEQQNQLFTAAIDEATMLLEKQGEFFPFAFGMKQDGSITVYSAFDGDECPPSSNVISQLIDGLQQEAKKNKIIACAIAYEVNGSFGEPANSQSAICVALEHESSAPVTCFQPYELKESKYQDGNIVAQEGDSNVFV